MSHTILNITNGDAFNDYFLSTFGGEAIPFREVMMDGDAIAPIFSAEFVANRTATLGVSTEDYREALPLCDLLADGGKRYDELCLWFGEDTFCQMNLLTLLAYLEEINYGGKVTLNRIDDEDFRVIEGDVPVPLGRYRALYEAILVQKRCVKDLGVLSASAVALYFDYRSDEGALARAVKENPALDTTALLCLLLEISKDYGLSDRQAEALIQKYRQ